MFLAAIRAGFFYFGLTVVTIVWGIVCLVVCPALPFNVRFMIVNYWSHFVLFWLRICCGISMCFSGACQFPDRPVIIISKHQSQWETFFLQTVFVPIITVLKAEILSIPIFGWALRFLDPIVINRKRKKKALEQIITQGREKLKEGKCILVFPEGTRIPVGENSQLNRGAFLLAKTCNVPILPVVHNAGEFWPPHQFIKNPGVIKVRVGPLIEPQEDLTAMMEQASFWMTQAMHEISEYELQQDSMIVSKCS